jgi:hypothetical protein
MDHLESAMRKVIDITDIGWKRFTQDNWGDFILYIFNQSSNVRHIARVSIPNTEDESERFLETELHWQIEKYPKSEGGDDFKINGGLFVNKEVFISYLSKKHPDDLEWLLFHPEWLE